MQLYPAIGIKEEKCVRLTQDLFGQVKIYSDIPSDMTKLWVEKGASFLHLVDLDDALADSSVNEDVVRSIIQAVPVPMQIGGGIRNRETIQYTLDLGVARTIIGTEAAQNPEFIQELATKFGPGHIAVGMGTRSDMVTIEGWEEVGSISAPNLCKQMKGYGVRHIVYMDTARDGTLSGPNMIMTKKLTMETDMDIVASDDVSSMEDLYQFYKKGIKGAIIGKALYEKRIDLKEAVACFGWNP